jgi:hypothetical protein
MQLWFMSETEIFYKYLNQIKEAYQQSDIKQSNWHYSLSSTPLYKHAVVLCGFNWGVSDSHEPQTTYPTIDFLNNTDLGSFKRLQRFIKYYLPTELHHKIVQINLCFFRSEKENDIQEKDLGLSKEIFKKLLVELQPKYFIAFTSRIAEVLKDSFAQLETKVINNGNRKIAIPRGRFKHEFGNGKFIYIPHPNYPLHSLAREEAWKLVEY